MVRTQDDGWIVGRKSDQREFYVIFEQKNANLLEVNGKDTLPPKKRISNLSCFKTQQRRSGS